MESLRESVVSHIRKTFRTEPEYPWMRFPEYAVFRHADNRKLFALVTEIEKNKLGLQGTGTVDILNVKVKDPLMADILVRQEGYMRGYHMSRGTWVTVLLDGSVPFDDMCRWLDESYLATASAGQKNKLRPPKAWIIPANPKYYDVQQAFRQADEINWKQGKNIKKGDTVFMYVAAPVSAVLYQCLVTETDIPYRRDGGAVRIAALMRIRRVKEYPPDQFTFDVLGEKYGIFAVRGPRGIPQDLYEALR